MPYTAPSATPPPDTTIPVVMQGVERFRAGSWVSGTDFEGYIYLHRDFLAFCGTAYPEAQGPKNVRFVGALAEFVKLFIAAYRIIWREAKGTGPAKNLRDAPPAIRDLLIPTPIRLVVIQRQDATRIKEGWNGEMVVMSGREIPCAIFGTTMRLRWQLKDYGWPVDAAR